MHRKMSPHGSSSGVCSSLSQVVAFFRRFFDDASYWGRTSNELGLGGGLDGVTVPDLKKILQIHLQQTAPHSIWIIISLGQPRTLSNIFNFRNFHNAMANSTSNLSMKNTIVGVNTVFVWWPISSLLTLFQLPHKVIPLNCCWFANSNIYYRWRKQTICGTDPWQDVK